MGRDGSGDASFLASMGTWGVDPFWSTSSVGRPRVRGRVARRPSFQPARSIGGWRRAESIAVSGTQTAADLTFEKGPIRLSGGMIVLQGAGAGIIH